jgi:hypothetical protein
LLESEARAVNGGGNWRVNILSERVEKENFLSVRLNELIEVADLVEKHILLQTAGDAELKARCICVFFQID